MSADHSAPQTSVRESLRGLRDAGAAGARELELQRRIRALVDELMREVIGAILSGSPAELAELIEALERRRSQPVAARGAFPSRRPVPGSSRAWSTPDAADARPRKRGRTAVRASDESGALEDRALDLRPSLAPNNPFDITSPGELLASTIALRPSAPAVDAATFSPGTGGVTTADTGDAPSREEAGTLPPSPPAISHGRAQHLLDTPSPRTRRTREPAPTQTELDLEAESERRPKIVLREGERLLSATESGVVIRRARLNTAR